MVRRCDMDRREEIMSVAGIILAAMLLTFGNVIMEAFFRMLGI